MTFFSPPPRPPSLYSKWIGFLSFLVFGKKKRKRDSNLKNHICIIYITKVYRYIIVRKQKKKHHDKRKDGNSDAVSSRRDDDEDSLPDMEEQDSDTNVLPKRTYDVGVAG